MRLCKYISTWILFTQTAKQSCRTTFPFIWTPIHRFTQTCTLANGTPLIRAVFINFKSSIFLRYFSDTFVGTRSLGIDKISVSKRVSLMREAGGKTKWKSSVQLHSDSNGSVCLHNRINLQVCVRHFFRLTSKDYRRRLSLHFHGTWKTLVYTGNTVCALHVIN